MVRNLASDDDMPARYADKLKLVQETAEQALTSVNLAGEMYKIETGRFKLDVKPVKVGEVLRRIVELSRATFVDKALSIVVDTDVPVGQELPQAQGDEALCHSLFHNLIKNACEAAPRKSTVSVVLKDENPLRVLIQNKGVVPRDIRDVFFDKFVTRMKASGSGLGTYSARLLAVAQHGSIDMSCDDEQNQTTLTVWLPRCALQLADKAVQDNPGPTP
jgi:two-component system, sensor histidine kinase and response regulator